MLNRPLRVSHSILCCRVLLNLRDANRSIDVSAPSAILRFNGRVSTRALDAVIMRDLEGGPDEEVVGAVSSPIVTQSPDEEH